MLLAGCALGIGLLALVAGGDERGTAFAFVPRSVTIVAVTQPGEEVCQRGLEAPARFDGVELILGTGMAPGSPLVLTVRETGGSRILARGRVRAGAADNRPAAADLDTAVPAGARIDVCARNLGAREVAFYGGPWYSSPGRAYVGGRRTDGNLRLVFLRSDSPSALSLVPDMFERAALFRPEPVGPWTFWLLLVLIAGGVPLLLAAALRAAIRT